MHQEGNADRGRLEPSPVNLSSGREDRESRREA